MRLFGTNGLKIKDHKIIVIDANIKEINLNFVPLYKNPTSHHHNNIIKPTKRHLFRIRFNNFRKLQNDLQLQSKATIASYNTGKNENHHSGWGRNSRKLCEKQNLHIAKIDASKHSYYNYYITFMLNVIIEFHLRFVEPVFRIDLVSNIHNIDSKFNQINIVNIIIKCNGGENYPQIIYLQIVQGSDGDRLSPPTTLVATAAKNHKNFVTIFLLNKNQNCAKFSKCNNVLSLIYCVKIKNNINCINNCDIFCTKLTKYVKLIIDGIYIFPLKLPSTIKNFSFNNCVLKCINFNVNNPILCCVYKSKFVYYQETFHLLLLYDNDDDDDGADDYTDDKDHIYANKFAKKFDYTISIIRNNLNSCSVRNSRDSIETTNKNIIKINRNISSNISSNSIESNPIIISNTKVKSYNKFITKQRCSTQATTTTKTTTPIQNTNKSCCNNKRYFASYGFNIFKTKNDLTRKYFHLLLYLALITCVPIMSSSASLHTSNIKYSTNIVKTKYGPLRGIQIRSNPTVEAFLGVPYATPPVGSLRFMPPVTPSTWRSTRLADRFSPACPQSPPVPPAGPEALLEIPRGRLAQLRRLLPLLANQSEDCLYLNLYVPRIEDPNNLPPPKVATIVYVHGESYEWNSGNPYDGSILAAYGNVIVVTINFRLGVLGFLKTGSKGSAQGNFGLMDLVAGLHWLRENLPAFNGDSTKITLMGHGTGAALANILIVSPVASDLINRAILLSGSALSPWAIQRDPLYVKRKVAERTGCHGDLLEDDLAPCLRSRPIAELLSVTIDSPRFLPGFAPFIDGTVIVNPTTSSNSPLTLPAGSVIASTSGIEFADFPTKELLFGLATTESYLDLSAQDLEFGFNETRRDRILRTYVRNVYHYHLNEIYAALKNEYTDWERPPRNPMGSRDAALELLSDGHTAAPLVRLGYLHSLRGGRSYFLHFRHQSGERDFPQRGGSVRGEDVPFCLGLPISPLFPYNYTKQDIKISRILVQYIANFAQTGNPNETPSSATVDISHPFNRGNHVVETSDHSKFSLAAAVTNDKLEHNLNKQKQKRRTNFNSNNSRRNKRNNQQQQQQQHQIGKEDAGNGESYEVDENGDGDDDDEDVDEGSEENKNNNDNKHLDRLDDMTNIRIPFWDTYDSINQLYLEMGNKIEIRNHYRGHKLSMWLSLIPQLHFPGYLANLSMRHHHFLEESAQYYDGIVRKQSVERPAFPKVIPMVAIATITTTTSSTTSTSAPSKLDLTSVTIIPSTTTECPLNATIVPTIAATRPQQNSALNTLFNNNNLLRRLANSQYQSYATALTVTIAVGCFLLLLNILIFAGIYYQREKRATDAKRKEELTDAESSYSSPAIGRANDKCKNSGNSRKSSLQSVSGFNSTAGTFGEYSCYDEKITQCKEKHLMADICSVELPLQEFKCGGSNSTESNTSSLRRTMKSDNYKHNLNNLMLYPPTYNGTPSNSEACSSGTSNGLVTYHKFHKFSASQPPEQCNQSTQSDLLDIVPQPPKDVVETVVIENSDSCNANNDDDDDDDDELGDGEVSPGIPEPPPPPRSIAPYGILRQQGAPTTPAAAKKRVQIQEISV